MIADAVSRTAFDGDVDPQAARAALADVAWEPGVAKPDPILIVDECRRTFGGLTAVNDVSFQVNAGEIFGLIGFLFL